MNALPEESEHVLMELHSHARAMVVPALVLLAAAVVLGLGVGLMPQAAQPLGSVALVVAVAAVMLVLAVRPWLVWRARSYTITDRRVIVRSGVVRTRGEEVAIHRIVSVQTERGLLDRLLGCGTLRLLVSEGEITLTDVPHVTRVRATLNRQLDA